MPYTEGSSDGLPDAMREDEARELAKLEHRLYDATNVQVDGGRRSVDLGRFLEDIPDYAKYVAGDPLRGGDAYQELKMFAGELIMAKKRGENVQIYEIRE